MDVKRTFKKTTIELFAVEKDIELFRAGWKDGQIIVADREVINGRNTNRCHIKSEGGKKYTLYIGFNCRRIPGAKTKNGFEGARLQSRSKQAES